jgi:tetratricopeptide (TPR) repeat protein
LWVLGALHLNVGHSYTRQGELDKAANELQMAKSYFEKAQQRDLLPELYGLLAEVAWRQGELATAEQHGQYSLELARELAMPREEGHNLRILGEIAQAQEQFAEAEQFFLESTRTLHQTGDEYETGRTQLSLAQLYLAQQQKEQAEAALTACEDVFERLDAQLDLAAAQSVRQMLTT